MTDCNDTGRASTTAKKPWVSPKAASEKVREITAAHPAHRNTVDGSCSS